MADYALTLSETEVARYRMMGARARADEAEAWQSAGIVEGARVADVGCGPGGTLVAIAEAVGPTGAAVGVDVDPAAIVLATEMIAQVGLRNATVRVGPADNTGLEPGSFDVVMMRHVLAHNGGREAAIVAHLAELVRPGGVVYLADVEMTAIRARRLDPDLADLAERYVEFQRGRGNDPQVGLLLSDFLRAAGLEVTRHAGSFTVLDGAVGMRPPSWAARDAMLAAGFVTAADIARWQDAFERQDAALERPVLFIPLFTAMGRRVAD